MTPVGRQHGPVAVKQVAEARRERRESHGVRAQDTSPSRHSRQPAAPQGGRRSSSLSSPLNMKASAKAPRSCLQRARYGHFGVERRGRVHASPTAPRTRCRPAPWADSRPCARSASSSRKFSMMPLWTQQRVSVACGWALPSVGAPWVAQRVCPMPICARQRLEARAPRRGCRACPRRGGGRCAPLFEGRHTGAVIAAIFEAPQRIDQAQRRPARYRRFRQCRTCSSSPFPWLRRLKALSRARLNWAHSPRLFSCRPRANGQCIGVDVLGNDAAGRRIGAVAHRNRRDQRSYWSR